MNERNEELSEFLLLPSEQEEELCRWTHGDTLILLDLYGQFSKQLGSHKIKSLRKMFEVISNELKLRTGKNISPSNCENKWRVLLRRYKKHISDLNRTGGGRKVFEYFEEMQKILGRKDKVHSEILLSAETIDVASHLMDEDVHAVSSGDPRCSRREHKNNALKCHILKRIQKDRKEFYQKRLEQEERKILAKNKKNELLEELLRITAAKSNPEPAVLANVLLD